MKELFLSCALAFCLDAAAASRIVPALPTALEPVDLRMSVDSCTFNPESVSVRMSANVVQVTQRLNNCFAAGEARVADVRLGAFPPGHYRVDLFVTPQATGTPSESLEFDVASRVTIAIDPPPPFPLTQYTGMWWNAAESGWGLSVLQSATGQVFANLYLYGANGQPDWFTLPGGVWTAANVFKADLFHTTGPASGTVFNPSLVQATKVGTATLEFLQVPGTEGTMRFTYTINGVATTKTLSRLAF